MLSQGPFSYNRFDELDQKFPGIFESKDEEKCDECGKKNCGCSEKDDDDDDKKGSKKNKKRPNFWQDSDGDGKWYEKGEDVKEEYIEEKKGRCWTGYKPTPGKKPYSPGSCQKEEVIAFLMDEGYANNEVSAEVLYDHMSDEWLQAINEAITE